MKIRKKVAAAVVVGASLVLGGIAGTAAPAEAAESTSTRAGSSIIERLCKAAGGYYYEGKLVAYCWLPDGSTIACYGELGCTKYPPKENVVSTPRPVAGGVSQVAR